MCSSFPQASLATFALIPDSARIASWFSSKLASSKGNAEGKSVRVTLVFMGSSLLARAAIRPIPEIPQPLPISKTFFLPWRRTLAVGEANNLAILTPAGQTTELVPSSSSSSSSSLAVSSSSITTGKCSDSSRKLTICSVTSTLGKTTDTSFMFSSSSLRRISIISPGLKSSGTTISNSMPSTSCLKISPGFFSLRNSNRD
mmetsp:Transcript_40034/g.58896  ORF Transcript_40034/g.58896 Transcript_40034/m.58896 type:complete len:201 (+) Transcript_40034:867-1469(+)